MWGQGAVSRPEQQSERRSAAGMWALLCRPLLLGFTQHSALQLGLAGAIPAVSKEIAITSVTIFPNDCLNKWTSLLKFYCLPF
jgi:hypothetical protein